ncbi:MAG: UDP-2,3-diacylglucosamine diphosphatase LpxI [Elusimicrobiales bacterium]
MNKIGLIAGAGKFPEVFAREAAGNGCEVFVAGIKDVTSPELEKLAHVEYFRLGQLSAPARFFVKNGVKRVAMAGLVRHNSIFGGVLPDLRAAKLLASLPDMRAETILRAVAAALAEDGLELVSSATFLENLLAKPGNITKSAPDKIQLKNIALGWKIAKELARLDAGLAVVMADMSVVALEAMEGTDKCILRAGEIHRAASGGKSGLVVVKVGREKQDFRFDLPVIGMGTIESMRAAGARVLAVEAGKTLIIDGAAALDAAEKHGICVCAFAAPPAA